MSPPNNKNGSQVADKGGKKKRNGRKRNNGGSGMGSSLSVANVSYAKNLAPRFEVMPTSRAGSLRVRGQDFLVTLRTPSGSSVAPGDNLATLAINPLDSAFQSTRVQAYARLFEKYLIHNMVFHYQPAVATSVNGQIVLAYDRDPSDDVPPANIAGIHQYLAMMGAKTTQLWTPSSVSCPLSDLQDFYYCNSNDNEPRLTHQGQFFVANVTGCPVDTDIGNIWIEYDITFFDPQLEPSIAECLVGGVDAEVVTPDEGTIAWQAIVPSDANPRHSPIKFHYQGEDVAISPGHFEVPGGTYALLEYYRDCTASFNLLALQWFPNIPNSTLTEVVMITEDCDVAGDSAFRLCRLDVPRGGGKFTRPIGSPGGTTITCGLIQVRLLSIDGFQMY